jgi:hypothetical protein
MAGTTIYGMKIPFFNGSAILVNSITKKTKPVKITVKRAMDKLLKNRMDWMSWTRS